jgi:hypothetical protein
VTLPCFEGSEYLRREDQVEPLSLETQVPPPKSPAYRMLGFVEFATREPTPLLEVRSWIKLQELPPSVER